MKNYRVLCILLAVTFLLTACSGGAGDGSSTPGMETSATVTTASRSDTETAQSTTAGDGVTTATTAGSASSGKSTAGTTAPAADGDMFTDRDYTTSYGDSAAIKLQGTKVAGSAKGVSVSGSVVTITAEGSYTFSGTLEDGMIVVNAAKNDKVHIVLDGVSITSKTAAALYLLQADKVFVTLAKGSKNTLANGGTFVAVDESNLDAAVFAKTDVTFNGEGSLTVTSPAGHGVVCKDDLVFTGGTYTVSAASHGLEANDSVRISGAALTVDAGKDGIHAEDTDDATTGFVYMSDGRLKLEAEGDGISAAVYAQIAGGTVDIVAGGGSENGASHSSGNYGGFMGGMGGRPGGGQPSSSSTTEDAASMKGIKAVGNLLLSGGTVTIDSADDSLHSNASVTLSGGSYTLDSGDDGVHADVDLTITGGTVDIRQSYEGLEAVNVAVKGGKITLTAADDGINAAGGNDSSGSGGRDNGMFGRPGGMHSASNGSIVISGGELHINASGDGIDANGYLKITGGYTTVVGPTKGDTATLDYDTSAVISGGTFIGTGAAGMAQTFSASENQGVVSVSVGNQSAGTEIQLIAPSGKTLITYKPALSFAVVILSSPEIDQGTSYTVKVGDATGEIEAT